MRTAMEGMGTTPEYAWIAVSLSVIALLLSFAYAWRVVRSYRTYHDERSAVALAKAIGLFFISVGFLVSAAGLVAEMAVLSVAGLSLSRGVFIVLITTLVLADVRPRGDRG